MATSNLDPRGLQADTFVDEVLFYESVTSTNDVARQLAEQKPDLPSLLVVAAEQTAGRGRGVNKWWTGPESLAFSLLLAPGRWELQDWLETPAALVAGTALVETVSPLVNDHVVGLHWPNDVFADGRKLAGVLIERIADGRLVVGVGLNVNDRAADAPAELADSLVTLADLTGRQHDRTELLAKILGQLDRLLVELARDPERLGRRFDELCLQQGQALTVAQGQDKVTGVCQGIEADGALVLLTEWGPRRLYGGTVIRR